jgi:hypothetical protein
MSIIPPVLVAANQPVGEPYLSVVVATRNDDHGGDPLRRLQTFVNSFDEQCRRTGLDAEVIVVEWNPPPGLPRVSSLLRLPPMPACAYRFIDVPPEQHQQLQFADALPLFQMIAKNVGIRRARGRFVLATNIEIIFSNELVEFIASGRLEPGCMYRVDRHDVETAVPVEAPLEARMDYCAEHHLRIHASWGSVSVDPRGRHIALLEDIVDNQTVALGSGWHVREGANPTGFYRWATACAQVHVDLSADQCLTGGAELEIEFASNPYRPGASIGIDVADEAGASLERFTITGRQILRIPIQGGAPRRTIELRVAGGASFEATRERGLFERRGALHYVVRSIKVVTADAMSSPTPFVYPATAWRPVDDVAVRRPPDRPEWLVVSNPIKYSYCLEYGPLRAAATGTYRFDVTSDVLHGAIALGALSGDRKSWLAAATTTCIAPKGHIATVAVSVKAGDSFFLVLSNDHPRDRCSWFRVKELSGSVPAANLLRQRSGLKQPSAPGETVARTLLARAAAASRRAEERIERRRLARQSIVHESLRFPLGGWRIANNSPALRVEHRAGEVRVVSDGRKWAYCIEYGPQSAPVTGTYHFELCYDAVEGGARLGVLSADRNRWLPSVSKATAGKDGLSLDVSLELRAGQSYWLTLFNDHPDGDGVSRITVRNLTATVDIKDVWSAIGTAATRAVTSAIASVDRKLARRRKRVSFARRALTVVRETIVTLSTRVRRRIVYSAPEFASAEQAYRTLEAKLAQLAPFGELEHVYALLQTHRPAPLHLNGCGDFQLMAREHWFELRGYPEFQTFSMNIDALLSCAAHYAGVRECVLESPLHIYHIEHERGSGWTPEGEGTLRRRIAERGVTWLDSRDVFLWAAYMHWLNRPMIFNPSDWGLGTPQLEEIVLGSASNLSDAVRLEL